MLVIASMRALGLAALQYQLHQLQVSAQACAVIWQRLMYCVVNPLIPYWFFNSSKPFSQSARAR